MKLQLFMRNFFSLLFLLFTIHLTVDAQVTTATLSGTVKDDKGAALSGASVLVEYPDAGIKITIATKADGRFTVPNLRVGGPYKVSVTSVGFQKAITENLMLELGLNNEVAFAMEPKTGDLEKVTIIGRSKIFDNKRTGASTNISSRLIKALPTISRSADDYLRLTPSASANYNGISFAGRNGQYNNFSLDGAVFNNPFGLDAPAPGGQTNAQPVSLDAIDQIQVNIAPYDVTQAGFTGAGVNTVTKSGNNNFTGTVYGFFRNDAMTGKKVDGNKFEVPSLSQLQTGVSLGGAIKKDKLFYFVNFETEQRSDAATAYLAQNASNNGKTNTSRVLEADLQAVSSILKTKFGYETGPYQGFSHDQKNYKWLAKLDWNINTVHKLSFTYNGLDAKKDKPAHPSAIRRRGPDFVTLQFRNSGYEIVNKLHSFGAELKSNFKGDYANKLRVVYTTFRDKRNPFSTPFPVLNIVKNNVPYIIAGHEPFSINNVLNQDAFQVTNNFNIYKKNHSITVGASFESFKFGNSFNLTGYGNALFADINLSDFLSLAPTDGNLVLNPSFSGLEPISVAQTRAKAAATAAQWSWYYLTVGQLSAYAQDEWQISDKFRLTYGLRTDMPVYNEDKFKIVPAASSPTIPNNDPLVLFDQDGRPVTNGVGKDLDNTKLPTRKPLFSPRIGFNYDVKGDKTFQLRGGSGLFTGRFPFVWLGNHIGNPFSFFYNVTDRNFKWPQVWRTNLGADYKIPFGTVFTIDAAYTKDVNAMMVRNYKLGTPTGTLNDATNDKRKIYTAANQGANNAYIFTNTKVGYQFNLSLQAQQSFNNGLFAMAAYNFGIAKDASSISAEISSDAFDRNPILNNANEARLSNSLYGNTHRFLIALSKKYEYGTKGNLATTVSIFANWSSGNRFAYVYGGDINNDGTSSNDLLYVPTDAEIDLMVFDPLLDVLGNTQNAAAQRAGLKQFIAQDKYLNGLRGQYTEKYGGVTPGYSQIDMRILQGFNFGKDKKQTLQLSLDFVNLGNLLSSKWGVRKYATTSGYYQPLSVQLAGNIPTYRFDPSQKETFVSNPELQSRWQMQFGVRYIF
jgi:Carboxypeptidase regulatory-like domain